MKKLSLLLMNAFWENSHSCAGASLSWARLQCASEVYSVNAFLRYWHVTVEAMANGYSCILLQSCIYICIQQVENLEIQLHFDCRCRYTQQADGSWMVSAGTGRDAPADAKATASVAGASVTVSASTWRYFTAGEHDSNRRHAGTGRDAPADAEATASAAGASVTVSVSTWRYFNAGQHASTWWHCCWKR